ncbi:MAG: class I SAM-dependent methyltransferase [Pseudomonadales bacterium]
MRVDARDYWRCPVCEATFLDPARRPDRAAELAEYQLHCNAPDDAGYRRFLQRLAAPLLERLAPARHGLDYGCGPVPVLAAMLRAAGHTMAVYDPFFCADPAALTGRYDFITCSEVVEHFHRPAEEFARLDRLLAPGGWLALMTNFQTDDARFANWHYRRDPTHVVFYREATFHHLAWRHGWVCEIPARNVALLQKVRPAEALSFQ